jgi:hypothetical protein
MGIVMHTREGRYDAGPPSSNLELAQHKVRLAIKEKENVMKTTCKARYCVLVLFAATLLGVTAASADDFYPSYLPAKVIGHVAVPGGVRQMFLQRDGRRQYLYVQQPSKQGFLVVDITNASQPRVVNQVSKGTLTMVASGLAIAESPGNSASAGSFHAVANLGNTVKGDRSGPTNIRVLDVSDPAHPQTAMTFNGVTSILEDPARNLVYIANENGVSVLSHQRVLRRHECGSSDAMSPDPNCN